jgi:uncharacterized protein DUF6152
MKIKLAAWLATAVAVLLGSSPVFAHHGRVGYDNEKVLTLKATVTGFEWSNPHVQIHFDAPDEKGVMQHWTAEAGNPFAESRVGWTKDEFKTGDQITITFHPAKNGNGVGLFMKAILPGGKIAGGGAAATPDAQ